MKDYDKELLAKETKEILEYFFLEQSNDFIEKSSRKEKKFSSRKSFEKLLMNKEKYTNKLWDEKHTIVNYLLSHKDFKLSNTKLNELAKITSDWSSPDCSMENALFYLVKKSYPMRQIVELIENLNINYYQKNKNSLYFVNYFFQEQYIEKILTDFDKGINNFPEIRMNKYFESYISLIETYPQLYKETITIEKEKYDKIKEKIVSYDFKQLNKNQIGINLQTTLEKIEKIFMFFDLDNKYKEKQIKEQKRKI